MSQHPGIGNTIQLVGNQSQSENTAVHRRGVIGADQVALEARGGGLSSRIPITSLPTHWTVKLKQETRARCVTLWGLFITTPLCWEIPYYVAAKATYICLLHGKIGFLGFFSALAP